MFQMRLLSLGVALGYCFVPLWAGQISEFHQFAHLGDGGGVQAVFLIGTDATDEVTVNLRFFKSDGSELSLRIGNQTGASLNFTVPAGGTLRLVTAGDSDPIQTGWAQVFATEPVRAQLLFEIRVDDKLVTQAAVDSSQAVRNASVFVDQRSDSNTGLAIANTSQSGPIRVILTLRDDDGQTVATEELILPALGHAAKFIFELFKEVGTVQGTLSIRASGRFIVVALQQTGLVLGTLPPVSS